MKPSTHVKIWGTLYILGNISVGILWAIAIYLLVTG